jgi:hypothetical protein
MKSPILPLVAVFGVGLSSAIMLYIALATPMGPWIETTIALMALIPLKFFYSSVEKRLLGATPIVASAGVAGIIATAVAFSVPAIGFIDPTFFPYLIDHWWYALVVVGGLIVVAGMLGISVAVALRSELMDRERLSFPIGSVVYEMIVATGMNKVLQLVAGTISALIVVSITGFSVLKSLLVWGIRFRFDTAPLFCAVGFIAGPSLIIPLLVGVVSRFFLIEPTREWYFPAIPTEDFLFSFFTGIVFFGALHSIIVSLLRVLRNRGTVVSDVKAYWQQYENIHYIALAAGVSFLYFTALGLSIPATILVIGGAVIACQQLALIAGKMGIAPLGRYATFVMVPALAAFTVSPLLATLISAYVEIAGGVAADVLFGIALSDRAQAPRKKTIFYQMMAVVLSAFFCVGILLMLIKAFGLGSSELFALKAKNRAWLIMAHSFDFGLIFAGAVFAAALSYCSVNPVLVLGGLAMPADASLLLVLGAAAAHCFSDPREWYPAASGIFAATSFGMVVKALIMLI